MNLAFFTSIFSPTLSSFSGWDWLSIVGPALVVIGLGGELWLVYENSPFNPHRPPPISVKHFKIERASVIFVGLGVAVELMTVPHSLMEIAELQSKNLALELKIQPRRITHEQMTNFIFLTERVKKIPIALVVAREDVEVGSFATDLRTMFSRAKFETNPDANADGINEIPDLIFTRKFGIEDDSSLTFFLYRTNYTSYGTPAFRAGIERPILPDGNDEWVYAAIKECCERIGIKTEWLATTNFVAPGKCAIFVKPR
jgi:hypothetical protein